MSEIRLPPHHPYRSQLANEVHARPPLPLETPSVVSCLALLDADAAESYARLEALAAGQGVRLPEQDGTQVTIELPSVQVKWERHGEFISLAFARPLAGVTVETLGTFPTALDAVPADWLASLPGKTIAAADIALLAAPTLPDTGLLEQWFTSGALGGSKILDGAGWVFTDFVTDPDRGGRTRWLALDAEMGATQRARLVQRLIEIETYRMVALLSLPLARSTIKELDKYERRLEEITYATAALAGDTGDEPDRRERKLLDELTQLAAQVEHAIAESAFRFSAGSAYWEIVTSRVAELREQRVGAMRTLGGFLSRRMAPAMSSAAAAAARTEEVSKRIERASTLLRTRVDVALEEQNQQVLKALDRRSQISFRVQQAVEGLSIAAISYYGASLIELLLKPLESRWHSLGSPWIVAGSIPVIAVVSWRLIERIRRGLTSP